MTEGIITKVAVVTGAGQGIGKGIAKRLRDEGYAVVIADLVPCLISPRSGFITGQNFVVDGGMTRKMIYVA
jgi:NAD(P)-dependent dehydrogenase (short-subunit alcohol dehydrogenase family)